MRIHGVVKSGGRPVEGAYITLNQQNTFIAERRTGADGMYEFNTTPGEWMLICRSSGNDAIERSINSTDETLVVDFEL